MTASGFPRALKRVLAHEGGWSNHPRDPGGVTLEGVIQRVYDADRRRRGLPPRPLSPKMRHTPEWIAERDAIYRRQYWIAARCDELPAGVDYCVFDGAVNSGPVQSVKWMQRALRADGVYSGADDGHIGVVTIAAALAHTDHDALIAEICRQRLAMLRTLRTWGAFGVGWSRRVNEVRAAAQAWATGESAPKATAIPSEDMAKADDRDVKVTETAEGKADVQNATSAAGGGLFATIMTYYDTASIYLSQLSGLPEAWSKWIIGGLAAAAALVAIWLVACSARNLYASWRGKRRVENDRAAAAAAMATLPAAPSSRPLRLRQASASGEAAAARGKKRAVR